MSSRLSARRTSLIIAVLAAAHPLNFASAAVIDSAYTGANMGVWSNAANWTPAGIPINNVTDQFNVTIGSKSVVFDIAGSNSINSLTLTSAGLSLNSGDNLTVLNSGSLTGSTLFANGATFSGDAISTVTATDLTVFTPGSITLGGITGYTTQSDSNNHAWFSGGTGATLSANNLTTIHLQGGGLFLLQAQNSGTISLPALTTLDQVGTRQFMLQAIEAGSTINIPSFGGTAHANISVDIRDGGTVTWGAPTTLTASTIAIQGASTINTSALTNVDASKLSVSNGSSSPSTPGSLSLPSLVSYTNGGNNQNPTTWIANGAGSTLSANALTTIHLLPATSMFVTAQNGATVNFNALNTIDQTGLFNSALILKSYGASSTINIPAFGNVIPWMVVDVEDGGTVNWGTPTTLSAGTLLTVRGAATINTSALTNVDGVSFDINNGSASPATPGVLSLPLAITTYSTASGDSPSDFVASGPGTVLSANGLTTIHLLGTSFFILQASNGGTLNLNALTTIDHVGTKSVNLGASGASSVVNIPLLSSAGITNFKLRVSDGGTINWGSPTNFTGSTMTIQGASTINTAALSNIDGSRLDVSHGVVSTLTPGTLSLPAVTSYTTPNDTSFFAWTVSNNGSSLSLNGLTTLHLLGNNPFSLSAQSGATLNLNGLTTLDHSGGNRAVVFEVLGGNINLGSLHSIGPNDSIHLSNDATASLGGFASPFTLNFDTVFSGPGGPLNVYIDGVPFASIPNTGSLTTYHSFNVPPSSTGLVTFVTSGNPSNVFILNYLTTAAIPGDANIDGTVNFADFVQLSNHYGQINQGWLGGDFNNDNLTNFADFVILSNHYGQSLAGQSFTASPDELAAMQSWATNPTSVPEPASLALLGLAAAPLLIRRRRRQ